MENRNTKREYLVEKLILATGSNPKIWEMMQTYGHAIVSPVPSYSLLTSKICIKNYQVSRHM
jgi:hypothetical protein